MVPRALRRVQTPRALPLALRPSLGPARSRWLQRCSASILRTRIRSHGCFWKYHPAKAYAWELRLQDEIRPDFTIDEADSDALRKRFLADNKALARELQAAETKRRERKAAKGEADEPPEQDPSEPEDREAD